MHRQPLLDLLTRYESCFPQETEVVARIRNLVQQHEDCFERTCLPGHVTGSAWILSHDRQRSLLVHHRKLNRWLQPGGHADGQAEIEAVALREAQEETGLNDFELVEHHGALVPLDLDVHLIPARHDPSGTQIEPAHEHHDVRFLLIAAPNQTPIVSEESNDVRWFTEAELLAATNEESVLRMHRKASGEPG